MLVRRVPLIRTVKWNEENGVFETVFEKVSKNWDESPELLIAGEYFLTHLIHGNSDVSDFQLTRGYYT